MKSKRITVLMALVGMLVSSAVVQARAASPEVKEVKLAGPRDVTVKLRMEGPYTADVPLQVVCYFKYTRDGTQRMTGAPVELDKKLGGIIGALRERGEFAGDELETLLIIPPPNSIKAKAVLLVGLGDEGSLALDTMERVGRVALREAVRLGATRIAFAPLLRDQGNAKLDTGDVERAVLRGVILAYDTEKRLQQEGIAQPYALEEWIVEAGPTYFDETQAGVQKGIAEATAAAEKRPSAPHKTAN